MLVSSIGKETGPPRGVLVVRGAGSSTWPAIVLRTERRSVVLRVKVLGSSYSDFFEAAGGEVHGAFGGRFLPVGWVAFFFFLLLFFFLLRVIVIVEISVFLPLAGEFLTEFGGTKPG